MNKEETIRLIQSRIKSEHAKHPHLNWELIAAAKIYHSLFREVEVCEATGGMPMLEWFINLFKRRKDANIRH